MEKKISKEQSLEDVTKRIKQLKSELKNAKKIKKSLSNARVSSRLSRVFSSDSLSAYVSLSFNLCPLIIPTSPFREEDSMSESESELSESDFDGSESEESIKTKKKKQLGKWAKSSLTNIRDLASRDSSSSKAMPSPAAVTDNISAPQPSKGLSRHKRSLSFLGGRKKSNNSSSSSDESSYVAFMND